MRVYCNYDYVAIELKANFVCRQLATLHVATSQVSPDEPGVGADVTGNTARVRQDEAGAESSTGISVSRVSSTNPTARP